MSKPENPMAFPSPEQRDVFGHGVREGSDGMTLRDWFAAKALPVIIDLAVRDFLKLKGSGSGTESDFAEQAYAFADALLTERAKGGA